MRGPRALISAAAALLVLLVVWRLLASSSNSNSSSSSSSSSSSGQKEHELLTRMAVSPEAQRRTVREPCRRAVRVPECSEQKARDQLWGDRSHYYFWTRPLPEGLAEVSPLHMSSAPLISGDTFRAHADWVVDQTCNTDDMLARMRAGDVVFVKQDMVETFMHGLAASIAVPYVLLTHNSDFPVTFAGVARMQAASRCAVAWFATNLEPNAQPAQLVAAEPSSPTKSQNAAAGAATEDGSNSQLQEMLQVHPLPIGMNNRYLTAGDLARLLRTFGSAPADYARRMEAKIANGWRPLGAHGRELLVSFTIESNPVLRRPALAAALKAGFEPFNTNSQELFYQVLKSSLFVLAPPGNGMDTHRLWETLMAGAVPIVPAHYYDRRLLAGLPVLEVPRWSMLTREWLAERGQEVVAKFKAGAYRWEHLHAAHWLDQIDAASCGAASLLACRA